MKQDTSWNKIGKWYTNIVGEKGHYYHRQVIIPNVKRLMNLKKGDTIIDLACGQGILSRYIPDDIDYLGIDSARYLIEEARKSDNNPKHHYGIADISQEMPFKEDYNWVTIILALQNVKSPFKVIRNAAKLLKKNGRLLIVLNHPAFRIPKHSSWTVEPTIQQRKIDSYMSPMQIPIDSSPYDKRDNKISWSFHYPISAFSEMLYDNGFLIEKLEEWVSDKKSTGAKAQVEDKARREFPLFLAILAVKK